jgi:hypothetical protein
MHACWPLGELSLLFSHVADPSAVLETLMATPGSTTEPPVIITQMLIPGGVSFTTYLIILKLTRTTACGESVDCNETENKK